MAKEKSASGIWFFLQDLFNFGVYKRSQGKVTRQVTFATLAIGIALGAWQLFNTIGPVNSWQYILPGLLLAAGLWISYRVVNFPMFADFLIAVEAEMNKVSWPTRKELTNSTIVVIFVIVLLAALLFLFDMFWRFAFGILGIF